MYKIEKEILKESFSEIIKTLEDNDLELVEANTLEPEHNLDAINLLTFRSFNSLLETEKNVYDLIKEFEDPYEYATFRVVKIEDLFIVFVYI